MYQKLFHFRKYKAIVIAFINGCRHANKSYHKLLLPLN